jgi:hypothetical protein
MRPLHWLSRMLSDPTGCPDDGRVLAFMVTAFVLFMEWYWVVWLKKPWDVLSFCGGIAALNVVYGVWLRIRGDR